MQVIKYIYSLSMLVPSSAYLLQPFISKLILRGPSQSTLGCFAGCVVGDMCAGEHTSVWVWLGIRVRGNVYNGGTHIRATPGVSLSWLLCCTALHPQITRRYCSKFRVVPMSIWTSQNSSTVSSLAVVFIHTGALPSCRAATAPLSQYRLNLSRPCVCAFTYLSSSIIFTADTSTSSRCCCSALQL